MEVAEYSEGYRDAFVELNTAWLERFYTVEPVDREMMDHVDDLVEKGAMVFFAKDGDNVMATCMTMPIGDGVWEICKLAAVGQYTGTGAGSSVFSACMQYAISKGARKLSLISCRALKPAIHIYEKYGFKEVPLNKAFWGAEKADIEMEYIVEDHHKDRTSA